MHEQAWVLQLLASWHRTNSTTYARGSKSAAQGDCGYKRNQIGYNLGERRTATWGLCLPPCCFVGETTYTIGSAFATNRLRGDTDIVCPSAKSVSISGATGVDGCAVIFFSCNSSARLNRTEYA